MEEVQLALSASPVTTVTSLTHMAGVLRSGSHASLPGLGGAAAARSPLPPAGGKMKVFQTGELMTPQANAS